MFSLVSIKLLAMRNITLYSVIQFFSDCTDIQRMYQELSSNVWKTAYKAGVKLVKTHATNCAQGKIDDC